MKKASRKKAKESGRDFLWLSLRTTFLLYVLFFVLYLFFESFALILILLFTLFYLCSLVLATISLIKNKDVKFSLAAIVLGIIIVFALLSTKQIVFSR